MSKKGTKERGAAEAGMREAQGREEAWREKKDKDRAGDTEGEGRERGGGGLGQGEPRGRDYWKVGDQGVGEGARGFLEKQLRRDGVVKGTKRVPAQAEQREEPVARRRMHGV